MTTLDIRDYEGSYVTSIRFDSSNDRVLVDHIQPGVIHFRQDNIRYSFCEIDDLDNFVKALYKAKELQEKGQ